MALAVLLMLVAALVATLALTDGESLRGPLARYLTRHADREFRIDGPFKVHLLSAHPSVVAERVTIGNPPWSPPGNLAVIGKLDLVFDLPLSGRPFAVRSATLVAADVHLRRDAAGHANWLWKAPGVLPGKGLPPLYSLSLPDMHLALDDDRRHLLFDGTLSTRDDPGKLELIGKGHLNGRDVTLTIRGDPLANVSRAKPYDFTMEESSSGSHLVAHGTVLQPFDFRELQGSFTAEGADLKDLFYLLGVRLPNTGAYHFAGKIARHNLRFELNDLAATSGESDVHGTIVSQLDPTGHSHVDLDLHSQKLRLIDFGFQAAGRAAGPPQTKPLFLPEFEIRTDGIRRGDVALNFHGRELDAGPMVFRAIAGKMSIEHDIETIPSLTATLPDGKLSAHIKLDATPEIPQANLDLSFTDVRLGQFSRKDPSQPPLDGLLQGRLVLSGHGRSIHEIAAKSNGSLTLLLPQGSMRASLAELMGIDLRALGLLMTRNKEDTPVRCGVAAFQAHQGTLTAQTLVLDTDRMLITGDGTLALDTESLDLQLRGQPKHVRLLRLQAPIAISGTLRHPQFDIEKDERKLKLVDPGHGKDVDCGALLAAAKAAH